MKNGSDKLPSALAGKTVIVTGGNVGLGFESVRQLASDGAHVVIACRSEKKGKFVAARLLTDFPEASLEVLPLDLTDHESIHRFAETFTKNHRNLHILLNNAGVVNLKTLERTQEGWEMHFATNHLGHFALTGLLFETLAKTEAARVVTVSSGAYKYAELNFEDLHWHTRPYNRVRSYGDSKLANLLFMFALQRRFDRSGANAKSVSAHPGLTATERQQSIGIGGWLSRVLATPVTKGVRPQIMAATRPDAPEGALFGPRFGVWGKPHHVRLRKLENQIELQEKLWEESQKLTGVKY